ncbi:MAG TPA: hypothetical protein PLV75_11560 [Saprospiraceae bacterium]|nr:hypothetical protein [Saprospiraceae bacterium]
MGLTISYRGTLRKPDELELFLEDIADICMEIGWASMPIHRSNIMPVQGVQITPAGSESIWLTFLPNGRLYDPTHFIFTRHPDKEVVDEEKHKRIFTKTQYAGVDTHMAIIKFFRYLRMRYFEDFELRDDSQYWETNDISVCLKNFGVIDQDLYGLPGIFESLEDDEEDGDDDSAADRMDEALLGRGGFGINLN